MRAVFAASFFGAVHLLRPFVGMGAWSSHVAKTRTYFAALSSPVVGGVSVFPPRDVRIKTMIVGCIVIVAC